MIAWANGVNTKVRRGSSGQVPVGVLADKTRCGRKKTRPANQLEPKSFNVEMLFSLEEFRRFRDWFDVACMRGAISFAFPRIDDNTGDMVEYRFVPNTSYSWSNETGRLVKVSMQWETV